MSSVGGESLKNALTPCSGGGEQERDNRRNPEGRYDATKPIGTSTLGKYRTAAVASDSDICSKIGVDILKRGGSAVDAAIATLLCDGIANCQSLGIGGGCFLTMYDRKSKLAETIISREKAPLASTEDMFAPGKGVSSLEGGKASCVPGEIAGYWEAHQKYGKLPWKDLFEPSIKMAREGIPIGRGLDRAIDTFTDTILRFPELTKWFFNEETGEFKKMGDTFVRPKIADTLERIANGNCEVFYKGSLADDIVADLADEGGIITKEDLEMYRAVWKTPVTTEFNKGMKVYSAPPPASGAVLEYIINILDGYNLSPEDLSSGDERAILTYHRITEAMKFGFARRTELADDEFVDTREYPPWGYESPSAIALVFARIGGQILQQIATPLLGLMAQVIKNMTSQEYGESMRKQIDDDKTRDFAFYGPTFLQMEDSGTAHISVIDKDGNAIAATSTIGMYFGSRVVGKRTGIIFNTEMNNFAIPKVTNEFGFHASPANLIEPGKRPLSSVCPTIIVDADDDVKLVVGASGGPRILTTSFQVALYTILFGMDVNEAIDTRRIHHQLLPDVVKIEEGFPMVYRRGLEKKGHVMEDLTNKISVAQAILRKGPSEIQASSDWRKGGEPSGY